MFGVIVVKFLHQEVHLMSVVLKYRLKMVYTWGDQSYMESTELCLIFIEHQQGK